MSSPRLLSVKLIIKFCSAAAAIAAIVFAQLGPSDWQLRTGLSWETEHVLAQGQGSRTLAPFISDITCVSSDAS